MRYVFGECVLDTDTRQAMRGGRVVSLSPKGFDLLLMLIDVAPRAVRKLDLIRRIWPDANVTESSLSTLIAEVRGALGDTAAGSHYIRTLHRYGYAFIARVTREASAPIRDIEPAARWLRVTWRGGVADLSPGIHVIGRMPGAAVRLDHPGVSRCHAQITVTDGEATLEDLGSRNGTYVNRRRVASAVRLQDGDRVTIGPVDLTFEEVQGTTLDISSES
ncbi:MAG: FHA domain-containing protein [Vicinamibacteraceae bacterium]